MIPEDCMCCVCQGVACFQSHPGHDHVIDEKRFLFQDWEDDDFEFLSEVEHGRLPPKSFKQGSDPGDETD